MISFLIYYSKALIGFFVCSVCSGIIYYIINAFNDFPLTLHDPYSVYAYGLIETHNTVMWYILLILILVYWLLIQFLRESIWNASYKKLGLFGFLNTSHVYSGVEYYFISVYLRIWSFYFSFWKDIAELFFSSFFVRDFVELYTWIEWVPDIFRTICDFFDDHYTNYFIHLESTTSLDEVMNYLYMERKLLSYYCNHINSYYLYSEGMHNDMHLNLSFRHSGYLEFLFAFFPSLIVLLILIPSLYLLYSSEDNILEPVYTIKIIGHQWYWSYEFNHILKDANGDHVKLNFDVTQNLKIESDLAKGEYRLLEVENDLKFPICTPIRLIISSADVLHCWSLPAFGIKVDAVPGRLNAINTFIFAPGTFYGQCSELCGVGHGFMPIKVEAVPANNFLKFSGFNHLLDNTYNDYSNNNFIFKWNVGDAKYYESFRNYDYFLKHNSIINDLYYIEDINFHHISTIFSECKHDLFLDSIRSMREFVDEVNICWAKHAIFRHICIDSVIFGNKENMEHFHDMLKHDYISLSNLLKGEDEFNKTELPPLSDLNDLLEYLEDEIYYKGLKTLNADYLIKEINKAKYFDILKIIQFVDLYEFKSLNLTHPFKLTPTFGYLENYMSIHAKNSIDHINIIKVPNDFFFKDENTLWGSLRFGYTDTGETESVSVVISEDRLYTIFANGNFEIKSFSDLNNDLNKGLDCLKSANSLEVKRVDPELCIKAPSDLKDLVRTDLDTLKNFEKIKVHLSENSKKIWLKRTNDISDFNEEYVKRDYDKHIDALLKEHFEHRSGTYGTNHKDDS